MVPQGNVIGSLLCLLYTTDLPIDRDAITGTFTNDAFMLAPIEPNMVPQMKN